MFYGYLSIYLYFFLCIPAMMGVADAQRNVTGLSGVIRDQAPNTMNDADCGGTAGTANNTHGFFGTDFQLPYSAFQNYERGICGKECNKANGFGACGMLGADQTPVYAFTGPSPWGNVRSPASFSNWFHTTSQNIPLSYTIPLAQSSSSSMFTYTNDSFFPIDGLGWKDWCYDSTDKSTRKKHNFGFCMEAHTRFGYRGGEVFSFYGDDDLWVYINNYLVIDLGGLHPKEQRSVSLDTLPFLQVGNNYRLDFFYCERHTTESNLELTTSLEFYCAYNDWCGACEGTGQSCCTADVIANYCDDHDACTTDTCAVKVAPAQGGCVHTPINCSADACHVAVCSKTGGCNISAKKCDDGNACTIDTCDPVAGCQYTPKTCDDHSECSVDSCDTVHGCQYIPKNCNDSNACTIDSCDNSTGCAHRDIPPCDDGSACTRDSCDPKIGCVTQNLCDDGNPCTVDTCDKVKGCSRKDVSCGTDKCMNNTCDTKSGECLHIPLPCPDRDACSITSCSNQTGCSYTTKNCDLGDQCKVYSCDLQSGCQSVNKTCTDNNKCTQDLCDSKSGCYYPPVVIDDGDACTDDSCDSVSGVHHTNKSCDDHDACTVDTCRSTSGCLSVPKNCDDNDPCTVDTCNNVTGCSNVRMPNCETCTQGGAPISCATTDKCYPKACSAVDGCVNTTVNCNDGNACTADSCNAGVCSNIDIPCLPVNACDIASCDRVKGCSHTAKSCDDGNPCTQDSCAVSNGNCTHSPLATFCIACNGSACPYNDPCNPYVCDSVTHKCKIQPIGCNDNNACTNDTCVANGNNAVCKYTPIVCQDTHDVCKPNVCAPDSGCSVQAVQCNDNNKCTVDSCANINGSAQCQFVDVSCNSTDPCNPKVCSSTDGKCYTQSFSCDDHNACTNDSCIANNGNATCKYTSFECQSDECGPMQCNSTTGQCITQYDLYSCNDNNPCTNDIRQCNGTGVSCNYTLNGLCDDNDSCTNDMCDSSNSTLPCSHSNVTCTPPTICQVSMGCDRVNGCIYAPLPCSGGDGQCTIASCDPRAGCILEDRVCSVKDPDCYAPTCTPTGDGTGNPCGQKPLSNWAFRTSSNGVLCSLRYDPTAKKAAIGTGAAVGIAIGAAAAIGVFGFGGKKGYDLLKVMREQRFAGVQNNPLYENTQANADNPIYRYSTTSSSVPQ